MAIGRRAAVFVDKDGTLIEDEPYNVDPRLVRLMPGAAAGLRRLREAGFRLFVVSNQSGAARGYFVPGALRGVERRLRELLGAEGVELDGFAWCLHHPGGSVRSLAFECVCRKPRPGMITRLAAEHRVDLARSWMVGDILHDIEAGHRAGCRGVLIDNGHETEWQLSALRLPDFVAPDLEEAAAHIARRQPLRVENR